MSLLKYMVITWETIFKYKLKCFPEERFGSCFACSSVAHRTHMSLTSLFIPNKRFGFGVWLPLDEDVQDISSPYAVVLLLYFHDIRIELFHYL